MKKINIATLFILTSIVLITHTEQQLLYLRNSYRKPIQVKINGIQAQGQIQTGQQALIGDINTVNSLAIKATGSLQYKNLEKEINTIKYEAKTHVNYYAWLTIPDTNNILYWKPGIIQWIPRQNQPQAQMPSLSVIQKFLREGMTGKEFLTILATDPYPYGKELAAKIVTINRGSSDFNTTMPLFQTLATAIESLRHDRATNTPQTFEPALEREINRIRGYLPR